MNRCPGATVVGDAFVELDVDAVDRATVDGVAEVDEEVVGVDDPGEEAGGTVDGVTCRVELTGGVVVGIAAECPLQAPDRSSAAPTTNGPTDLTMRPVMRVLPIRTGGCPDIPDQCK